MGNAWNGDDNIKLKVTLHKVKDTISLLLGHRPDT